MGMLATVMNSIAVADALEKHGVDARVLCAVQMESSVNTLHEIALSAT
jgi:uridylate kinase